MDVRTFVSETLTQIVQGVADAQRMVAEMDVGARVNPTEVLEGAKNKIAAASEVRFDLAVTVASETGDETTKKAGAKASGFLAVARANIEGELGTQAANKERNEAISRVQFSVKLAQPADIFEHPKRTTPSIPRRVSPFA